MRRPFNRSSSGSGSSFPPRRPKPRPGSPGYTGHSSAGQFTSRPAPKPKKPIVLIKPKPPASGKQRRRQLKASAWRLSQLVHAPAAKIIKSLVEDRSAAVVLANRNPDRRGDAMRLANKIVRLATMPRKSA